jgi:hypothetical protein
MANNVGNISVKLGMDSTAFRDAITSVGADADKFTSKMEAVGGDAVGAIDAGVKSSRYKLTNTLNQLAFGFEDFTSQLGTGGVGAGIRATANNASQIAVAFGPIPLLMTVIGTTLASLIVPRMIDWFTAGKDIAKEMESIAQRLQNNIKLTEDLFRLQMQIKDIKSEEQYNTIAKTLQTELELQELKLKSITKQRAALEELARASEKAVAASPRIKKNTLEGQLQELFGRTNTQGVDTTTKEYQKALANLELAMPGARPETARQDLAERFKLLDEEAKKVKTSLESAAIASDEFNRTAVNPGPQNPGKTIASTFNLSPAVDAAKMSATEYLKTIDTMERRLRDTQQFSSPMSDEQRQATFKNLTDEVDLRKKQIGEVGAEIDRLKAKRDNILKSSGALFGEASEAELRLLAELETQIDVISKKLTELFTQNDISADRLNTFVGVSSVKDEMRKTAVGSISADALGSQEAFSAIARAISNSSSKADDQIVNNTKKTADAVVDLNNKFRDVNSKDNSTNITIATIGI